MEDDGVDNFKFEFKSVDQVPTIMTVIHSFVLDDGHNYCFKCNPSKHDIFKAEDVFLKNGIHEKEEAQLCRKCKVQLTTRIPKIIRFL